MSHPKSSTRITSPSLKGSKPVADVLDRIPVRDPYADSPRILGRRMSDYEIPEPAVHFVVLAVVTALIAGSLWLAFAQGMVQLWNRPPIASETLSIPDDLHIPPSAF